MKVLIVAPPWLPVPPAAYGGTELVVDGLCRGLAALGHDVTLVATGDSTCPVPLRWHHREALGTGRSRTAGMLAHVLAAYDVADALAPDIIHDHTILGAYVASTTRHRAITTNHNAFDDDTNPVYRRIARRVPVIAISGSHARSARGFTPIAAIHHGLDTDAIAPGSGTGGYALFLGRISPAKGVHHAIEAAHAIGMPLRIAAKVTEQPERDYLARAIEPRLGAGATFLGEVGGDAKDRLIGEAAVLVNPIQWEEPFGMVMIEAMARGTPVVACARGAAREIVDPGITGILVESTSDLPAALLRAVELDRSAVRARARERFSLDRMAREHVRAYEHVLAGTLRPSALDARRGALTQARARVPR